MIAGVEIAICKKRKKRIENQGFLFTGFVPTGWAPCCETWLRLKDKMKIAVGNRKKMIACVGKI